VNKLQTTRDEFYRLNWQNHCFEQCRHLTTTHQNNIIMCKCEWVN